MVYATDPHDDGEAWKATAAPGSARPNRPAGGGGAHVPSEEALVRELQLAFAPIHKRAFGIAVGVAVASVVMAVTLFHVLIDPQNAGPLYLLDEYFYGYTVTVAGVFIGGAWGFLVGFVAGWFVAFCRNLAIAVSVFVTRTRAELAETREFLDHI